METGTADAIRLVALHAAPRPRLVVMTGAGISAESGLRTYRGPDGLYSDGDLGELVRAEAMRDQPGRVLAHFQGWREAILAVEPNAAHRALARLEQRLGGDLTVVTQNIDFLHRRAGSQRVLEMHGSLDRVRCDQHGHEHAWRDPLTIESRCPATSWRGKVCGKPLRPHVVLFGEPVLHAHAIEQAIRRCTAFWAIGTSGVVMPAAGLVLQAKLAGASTALFNLTPPGAEADGPGAHVTAAAYDHVILGRAAETVPAAVDALIEACAGR